MCFKWQKKISIKQLNNRKIVYVALFEAADSVEENDWFIILLFCEILGLLLCTYNKKKMEIKFKSQNRIIYYSFKNKVS